jgi:hypothetical protein
MILPFEHFGYGFDVLAIYYMESYFVHLIPLFFGGRKTILDWRAAQWNFGTYRRFQITL